MSVMDMFRQPSAAHYAINKRQMDVALHQMNVANMRGGDSTEAYWNAQQGAETAMQPAYEHEMAHRHRDRNPFGIEAKSPLPPAPDKTPRELELAGELVGQHERRVPSTGYKTTVVPYGGWGRSHMAHATPMDSSIPVAEVKWNPHGGEIEWANTDEDHQRRGLASAMIQHGRDAAASTPGMTSPLPSPELSSMGLGLSRGILSKEQWGG